MGIFGTETKCLRRDLRSAWRGVCVLLFPSLVLAGCATAPGPVGGVSVNGMPAAGFCAVARLIRPSRADTPETLRQVLAHNEKVRRFCGAGKREG